MPLIGTSIKCYAIRQTEQLSFKISIRLAKGQKWFFLASFQEKCSNNL